ncbi:MAG TPA: hypothetical protein VF265_05770 [Nevskiaceae bacterium]
MLLASLVSGCALFAPQVGEGQRTSIDQAAQPGMTLSTARANLEASGFSCRSRGGSYFDASGEEHRVDENFVSCDGAQSEGFSFACSRRAHVVLVPNGDRVARVVVDTAPACTDLSPAVGRRAQQP